MKTTTKKAVCIYNVTLKNKKMKHKLKLLTLALSMSCIAHAQTVDYSVVSVPEEAGADFMKMTKESDYVCMPQVRRSGNRLDWFTNRIIYTSKDGRSIAFLSFRNGKTNIFIKDLALQGSSRQRTNRSNVIDFSYSPDGKQICFCEALGKNNQVFLTDAEKGYVCRQITSGNADFSPVYSTSMKQIFFTRLEAKSSSIWAYDVANNYVSSYAAGINPCPLSNEKAFICTRFNPEGRGEIWKIDYQTGQEDCIVSDPMHSYTTPMVSPDGNWILFVGDGHLANGNKTYLNTDIFACRTDGTDFAQLTYHAADDLSPIWSTDGQYIYFISQRGDANGTANIWRMKFLYNK